MKTVLSYLRHIRVAYGSVILLTASSLMASCGGDKSESGNGVIISDDEIPSEVVEKPSDIKAMSVVADSMALWADDLDAKEALAVLTTFYRVHLDAKAAGNRRRDIQTMRKYLDVYEIVASNHRDDLRRLLQKVSEADSTLDLIGAVDNFRALLDDYDSAHGQGSEYTEQTQDTVKTDTVAELPPLESIDASAPDALRTDDPLFRPAE